MMKRGTMEREEKITKLFEQDIEDIKMKIDNGEDLSKDLFLQDVLLSGWKGYNKMTDKEINEEYINRFDE